MLYLVIWVQGSHEYNTMNTLTYVRIRYVMDIGSGVEAWQSVRMEGDVSNPIAFERCQASTV